MEMDNAQIHNIHEAGLWQFDQGVADLSIISILWQNSN